MKAFNLITLIISILFFTSCEKDDPIIPNEEELITTVIYTLTPSGSGDPVILTFRDLDGDGGNDPIIEGGILQANSVYNGVLTLLNEQESPAEDITEEIEMEAEEHQFFFTTITNGTEVKYNDLDANDQPVGLLTTLTTKNLGNEDITIILRHEPNKSGDGVSSGNIANAGGETDIEVTFNVDVQ